MRLRMPKLTRRDDSAQWQFRIRVPTKLREAAYGRSIGFHFPAAGAAEAFSGTVRVTEHIKVSLRTEDIRVAKLRQALCYEAFVLFCEKIDSGRLKATSSRMVEASETIYEQYTFQNEEGTESPHSHNAIRIYYNDLFFDHEILSDKSLSPSQLADLHNSISDRMLTGEFRTEHFQVFEQDDDSESALESRFGLLLSWGTRFCHINIGTDHRTAMLLQLQTRMREAALTDRKSRPELHELSKTPKRVIVPKGTTFDEILSKWKAERTPSPNTIGSWSSIVSQFEKHLGHNIAAYASDDDVLRWKDHLLHERKLNIRTLNNSYLTCLNSIYNFAISRKMVKHNPAIGMVDPVKEKAGDRMGGYDDPEVEVIVQAALEEERPLHKWVSLILATSGARVAEITQLWASQICLDGDIWVYDIRPSQDGGTVKNSSSERKVPVHPVVIELGFLDFVKTRKDKPLFYEPEQRKPGKRHYSLNLSGQQSKWIRDLGFADLRKAPNHAFRHWFISKCSQLEIADSVVEEIVGHGSRNITGRYRKVKTETLAKAIASIPLPLRK